MPTANEELVRTAYAAYERGDVAAMLETVDPNLEWTYLDPSQASPEPQTCHGRVELEVALQRQLGRGLGAQLEELIANGDQIMVTVRIPASRHIGFGMPRSETTTCSPFEMDTSWLSEPAAIGPRLLPSRASPNVASGDDLGHAVAPERQVQGN